MIANLLLCYFVILAGPIHAANFVGVDSKAQSDRCGESIAQTCESNTFARGENATDPALAETQPFFIDLLSTPSNLYYFALLLLCVWIWVYKSLQRKWTEEDRTFERRTFETEFSKVYGVISSFDKAKNSREEYEEHLAKLTAQAEVEAKRSGHPLKVELRRVLCESEFQEKKKPTLPSMETCYWALMHSLGTYSVLKEYPLSFLEKFYDPETAAKKHAMLVGKFAAAHQVLIDRTVADLKKWIGKTKTARDTNDILQPAILSGERLSDQIKMAKKVIFEYVEFPFFGLGGARGVEPESSWPKDISPKDLIKTYNEAKAFLKEMQKEQPSRLTQLAAMVTPQMWLLMGVRMAIVLTVAPVVKYEKTYNIKIMNSFQLPGGGLNVDGWRGEFWKNCVCLVGIWIFKVFVWEAIGHLSMGNLKSKFTFTLRKRLFAALLRQDYSFYLLNDAGDLNARLDSTFQVANTLINGMVEVTGCVSTIYAYGAFAYSIYPQYLSVIGAFGFGGALVFYMLLRMAYHGDHALCRRSEKVMNHAREKARTEVKNLKTVREYSREATSKKEFKQRLKSQGNAELQRRMVEFAMWPIFITFVEVGLQVGNWMLARELNEGRLTVAEFISLGEMLYHIVFLTHHLMHKIPEMFAIQEPLNRIFTVMETVSNVEPMAGNAPKPKMTEVKFTGKFNEAGEPQFEPLVKGEKPVIDITFENVNFSYPNNPERQILDTLSLRAVGGKSTAFVGKSGCGKTTTIQLIKRFFDPEMGKVIVNGLPLATWDVRDYRSLMATVAQGVQLKEGTIRENLMYGMSESQKVEFESQGMAEADKILQKYCELACCWDNCIKELPLQFETRLGEGEGCIQLSGGQQACVAIARALIREPQLLILDEATAPLDAKTQEKVAKNIYDLQTERGMTVIMIAHRLDTLKACDAIFFFMYGSVVEGAGLDTLNRDAYKEMVAMRVTHAKTFVYDEGDDKFTGKEKSVVRSGRFKAQWNIDNDTKEYDEMDLADLDKEKEKLLKKVANVKKKLGTIKLTKNSAA